MKLRKFLPTFLVQKMSFCNKKLTFLRSQLLAHRETFNTPLLLVNYEENLLPRLFYELFCKHQDQKLLFCSKWRCEIIGSGLECIARVWNSKIHLAASATKTLNNIPTTESKTSSLWGQGLQLHFVSCPKPGRTQRTWKPNSTWRPSKRKNILFCWKLSQNVSNSGLSPTI